jgi:hypothetical protein
VQRVLEFYAFRDVDEDAIFYHGGGNSREFPIIIGYDFAQVRIEDSGMIALGFRPIAEDHAFAEVLSAFAQALLAGLKHNLGGVSITGQGLQ